MRFDYRSVRYRQFCYCRVERVAPRQDEVLPGLAAHNLQAVERRAFASREMASRCRRQPRDHQAVRLEEERREEFGPHRFVVAAIFFSCAFRRRAWPGVVVFVAVVAGAASLVTRALALDLCGSFPILPARGNYGRAAFGRALGINKR